LNVSVYRMDNESATLTTSRELRSAGEAKGTMKEDHIYRCASWDDVRAALAEAPGKLKAQSAEELWFRGVLCPEYALHPTLFRWLKDASRTQIDHTESDLFFEFQARARELHQKQLTDWDYLFFMRHHGVPTRILDWSDSFGIATYFAFDLPATFKGEHAPSIWVLNPYALNETAWTTRDLVQPKYLGYIKHEDEYWEYGELLNSPSPWLHDEPVALYPLQISDRMRAQRGWFTMFGNNHEPLEDQVPEAVARIELVGHAIEAGREFLDMAGLRPYTIYPDLDHLATELVAWHNGARAANTKVTTSKPKRAANKKR
jgi:hypothetical protein